MEPSLRPYGILDLLPLLQLKLLQCNHFVGHDARLERTLESALMVMEALEGYEEKIKFDILGHSGEESALPFVRLNQVSLLTNISEQSIHSNNWTYLYLLRP